MTDGWRVTEQGLVVFPLLVAVFEAAHGYLSGYSIQTATVVLMAVATIVAGLASRKHRLKYETELRRRLRDD